MKFTLLNGVTVTIEFATYSALIDGPCVVYTDANGDDQVIVKQPEQRHILPGRVHRLGGPAVTKQVDVLITDYAVHGEDLNKEDWDRHPLVVQYRLSEAMKDLAHEE